MPLLIQLLWIVLGYILGSFPTSLVIGRLVRGIDIREHGSGNAGATNTVRILGTKWGVIVGIVDLLKGFLAVLLPTLFDAPTAILLASAAAAVAGHAFPVFAKFRGGKGVATGAGIVLGLFPLPLLMIAIVFAVVLFSSGYVSLASIVAAAFLPVGVLFFGGGLHAFSTADLAGIASWVFSLAIALLVIVLHRKNIRRLKRGEENRFEKIRFFRFSRKR